MNKKFLWIGILALVFGMMVAGCGENEIETDEDPPLKTVYSETRSEYNGDFDLTNVGYYGASVVETYKPNLLIQTLMQKGYTHLKIDVSFDYRSTSTLFTTKLRVKLLNNKTGELGRADFEYKSKWTRSSFSRTVPIDATESITGDFIISWGVVDEGILYSVYSVVMCNAEKYQKISLRDKIYFTDCEKIV